MSDIFQGHFGAGRIGPGAGGVVSLVGPPLGV